LTSDLFHNRRAVQIENDALHVTVIAEGGHIAEIFDKASGVSPLWIPPWPSIEHSLYRVDQHPEYGRDAESKLLAGIMGHNLCLDLFGPPSTDEAQAGMTVHGEASIMPHEISSEPGKLTAKCALPTAQLAFERHIELEARRIRIHETVENLSALDRPIAWTQHVTLGPPFLERGSTQFRTTATRSQVLGGELDFDWPLLPLHAGAPPRDLQLYNSAESSAGFTTQLLDKSRENAWFFAYSPRSKVLCGYVWRRSDFPWLGIWEENHSRANAPWNGRTMTLGMEFGVSPFPESRRQMIERRMLFDTPAYRWLPAKARLSVDYYAAIGPAHAIPETLEEFEDLLR
jgi:hypothetical protein